ncbi:ribbon-helix-helix protein, CopG family [Streptacidiphilus sp. P02-A3a]|uniref:ribbon-helix-helix protein, CopG family n=1 Tax=Streptacidiphilus sp. P02-A3a TaxID=2704468 RepID=UPI0015FBF657|nr:ribbon-helix-helix protein, CopG family [Streptacidiphilus sp. P02-A3a]QMU72932.1 ribbon-helix-helix protein, CopG family [Streptacidiphilus sp. P02-A3a]
MAKTRISISLDLDQAERIRLAAEEGGQDVSAFVVAAALTEAVRRERIAASFADIDAAIAAAEAEAESLDWSSAGDAPADEESARIREQVAAARSRAAATRSRRNAA